jgi:tRNA (guanine-N7-)-methyltransferase
MLPFPRQARLVRAPQRPDERRAGARLGGAGPRYVIDVQRDAAATSVRPGTSIVPAEVFGRAAPLTVEIGSGQGHAIVTPRPPRPSATSSRSRCSARGWRARCSTPTAPASATSASSRRTRPRSSSTCCRRASTSCGSSSPTRGTRPSTTSAGCRAAVSAARGAALRDGGACGLATDWEDYALQMREVLADAAEFAPAFEVNGPSGSTGA